MCDLDPASPRQLYKPFPTEPKKNYGVTGVISLDFCRPPPNKEKHAYCCARSGRPWGCLGLCPSWSRPLIFRHPSSFLHVLCFVVRISSVPARCIRTTRVSSSVSCLRLAHYQIKMLLDVLDKNLYPSDWHATNQATAVVDSLDGLIAALSIFLTRWIPRWR